MVSYFDKNSFSSLDDDDDYGFATNNMLRFKSKISDLWRTNSWIFYRFRNKYFHQAARIESSEEEYESSGFEDAIDTTNVTRVGGNFGLDWKNYFDNRTSFYLENLQSIAKQNKISNNFSYNQNEKFQYIPSINYNYTKLEKKSISDSNSNQIKLIIHDLKTSYDFGNIQLETGYITKFLK